MTNSIPRNSFKANLATGRKQIGFWLTLASPAATEIAAEAGFDWLLIDMEHAANEIAMSPTSCAPACAARLSPPSRAAGSFNHPVVTETDPISVMADYVGSA